MAVALGGPVALSSPISGQLVKSSFFRAFSVLVAAVLISSCSDSVLQSPTSLIDPSAALDKTGGMTGAIPDTGISLKALWWNRDWEPQAVATVKQTINPSGGVIVVPQTGLTLSFPAGAVATPLEITVTSDDKYVAYRMEPSGTQFLKSITVTQLLSFTELAGASVRNPLFAAYIPDDTLSLTGKIQVLEIEPSQTILSPLTGLPKAQVWLVNHFSRYMLASG
jgi:hypothetical protein